MLYFLLFPVLIFFGIFIPILLASFALFFFISDIQGAPFVPTRAQAVDEILSKAKLKKGQNFLELGSGDGRLVHQAAKDYKVNAQGIEFNPLLVWYSRFIARIKGIKNARFLNKNFFYADFKKADVIFFFLVPRTIEKLKQKLLKETKKNVLVISHGFKIKGFENFLIDKIDRKVFSTFFYRLR